MATKFQVGDTVRFNRKGPKRHQVPDHVLEEYKGRSRKVIAIQHDKGKGKRVFYELAGQGRGRIGYPFRSHQLVLVTAAQTKTMGRPKTKRPRRAQAFGAPWQR